MIWLLAHLHSFRSHAEVYMYNILILSKFLYQIICGALILFYQRGDKSVSPQREKVTFAVIKLYPREGKKLKVHHPMCRE